MKTFCSTFVACIFLIAAYEKLNNPQLFSKTLKAYPPNLVTPLFYSILILEASLIIFVMIDSMFAYLIAIVLFTGAMLYQNILKKDLICHCFGKLDSRLSKKNSLIRLLIVSATFTIGHFLEKEDENKFLVYLLSASASLTFVAGFSMVTLPKK